MSKKQKTQIPEKSPLADDIEGQRTMNDRYRFRVWREKSKFNEAGYVYSDIFEECHWGTEKEVDSLEAEFCIGLKDRHGKLVFDGHIVRVFYYGDELPDESSVHKVVWGGGCLDYPAFDLVPLVSDDSNSLSYVQAEFSMEVIGNIHENPELLTEKDKEND